MVEVPGWRTRGTELSAVYGVVWHHTATGPNWSDSAVVNVLVNGRPDLSGPLSQCGLSRDGTYYVVAAGRAHHNIGTWGNDSIGIEAFNSGLGEPWPDVQYSSYVKGTAAILTYLQYGNDRCKAHRETDPTRKIDPTGIDMSAARRDIWAVQTGDDMPSEDFFRGETDRVIAAVKAVQEEVAKRESTQNDILRDVREAVQAIAAKP